MSMESEAIIWPRPWLINQQPSGRIYVTDAEGTLLLEVLSSNRREENLALAEKIIEWSNQVCDQAARSANLSNPVPDSRGSDPVNRKPRFAGSPNRECNSPDRGHLDEVIAAAWAAIADLNADWRGMNQFDTSPLGVPGMQRLIHALNQL